ncbi:TPA: hypothetical protein ACH3X1_008017 [Trebouxia sp. C0004]
MDPPVGKKRRTRINRNVCGLNFFLRRTLLTHREEVSLGFKVTIHDGTTEVETFFWGDTVPEVIKTIKDLRMDEGRAVLCFRHLAMKKDGKYGPASTPETYVYPPAPEGGYKKCAAAAQCAPFGTEAESGQAVPVMVEGKFEPLTVFEQAICETKDCGCDVGVPDGDQYKCSKCC